MLTGPAIREAVARGDIRVDPYAPENVGPCSLDLTLGDQVLVYPDSMERMNPFGRFWGKALLVDAPNRTEHHVFAGDRIALTPGVLYLACTRERVCTKRYAGVLHGRSSLGRLGVEVHQTAGFIDPGFDGVITLEVTVVHPVELVAGMRICQLTFEELQGEVELYRGKYQNAPTVESSRSDRDREWSR